MERIKYLVAYLNKAADAYYNGEEIISNYEYDKLYDELEALEKETGIVLPESPTQRAGYVTVDSLPKVTHEYPALSLDKTKDVTAFKRIFVVRDEKACVMWKLDGSTVIATYQDGKLISLATRGNGIVGSDITHNAKHLSGLPYEIPCEGKLVVRGEAVMSYSTFDAINSNLPVEEQYSNPRNLANASVSLLSAKEMSRRGIEFKAFKLVTSKKNIESFGEAMSYLKELGFSVVDYEICSCNQQNGLRDIDTVIEDFTGKANDYPYPVDGLVVAANDVRYAEAQPGTGHNPHKLVGYALKWQDESAETVLRNIEWQASRTGLLNPVAVFDPVDLEGTTVTKATLHNLSYISGLDLRVGNRISVIKANKIIPKVIDNLDKRNLSPRLPEDMWKDYDIPAACPVCGQPVSISDETGNGSYVAICRNPDCQAKQIGRFVHFVERDCINIIGMSEATIEKFVDLGYIKEYADFWKLDRFENEIVEMEGFGQKSYDRMQEELNKAKTTTFIQLIHSLGIPNIGKGQAKLLLYHYSDTLKPGSDIVSKLFEEAVNDEVDFSEIDGFGSVLNTSLHTWAKKAFASFPNEVTDLLDVLTVSDTTVPEKKEKAATGITGKTFVITGDVHIFKNRAELQTKIEELGGKATGSVSKNTSFLINNDKESTSGKNKKAKELGIPVISEEDFLEMIK